VVDRVKIFLTCCLITTQKIIVASLLSERPLQRLHFGGTLGLAPLGRDVADTLATRSCPAYVTIPNFVALRQTI